MNFCIRKQRISKSIASKIHRRGGPVCPLWLSDMQMVYKRCAESAHPTVKPYIKYNPQVPSIAIELYHKFVSHTK